MSQSICAVCTGVPGGCCRFEVPEAWGRSFLSRGGRRWTVVLVFVILLRFTNEYFFDVIPRKYGDCFWDELRAMSSSIVDFEDRCDTFELDQLFSKS